MRHADNDADGDMKIKGTLRVAPLEGKDRGRSSQPTQECRRGERVESRVDQQAKS
jgi:hypothetical protein